ncbi:hypothetical protein [Nonomuraea sp. NPDC050786]|uniref:hypothetical protein n=1 Tax=Nonomuraea sp. NPDC050786 TaxID=3154840 RepID=UPI0033CFD713
MTENDLLKLLLGKATESVRGGKMNGKGWIALVVLGVIVVVGFIAYRLVLIELITRMH